MINLNTEKEMYEMYCAVPFTCISLQAYADKQRAARSRPFGDQFESACEDQGKSD